LFELQVTAEHSYAAVSVFSEDVLEDLFETNMKTNARRCKQSDVYCFQSTQVTRSDVPDGTIVIQPDFPLSPVRCAAPTKSVSSSTSPALHTASALHSEVVLLTVTAAESRPTTAVIDCSEAQASDIALPSAVYDRVRDLFCMSDSDMNQNRLLNTQSSNTSSDTGQQNRHGNGLVTEAVGVICTTALSCSSDCSQLDSSYVDAGRMAYRESDVNVLSKVSVVSAADMPVMTTCIENHTAGLRITNIRSLRNNVDVTTSPEATECVQLPCQETCVKSSLSPSSTQSALKGGQSHFREKKLRSPTGNFEKIDLSSASKRKRAFYKENVHKCDPLFKKSDKTKRANKKRRLYNHNMLMEDEEQSQHLTTSVHVSLHNDGVGEHTPTERDCETALSKCDMLHAVNVPASVLVPTSSLTAQSNEASSIRARDPISDVVASCSNSVEVTQVEGDATQLALSTVSDLNTQPVTLLSSSMPIVPNISLEQQKQDMQHVRAVVTESVCGIEIQRDVAAAVSSSAMSLPVSSDRVCPVNWSVADVTILNTAASVISAEWPRSLNNARVSQMLTDSKKPSSCVPDKLLSNIECGTGIAAGETSQPEVATSMTEGHGNDSAVAKHTVDVSAEMLSEVVSESCHDPVVTHDDGIAQLAHTSTLYPGNDIVTGSSQRNTPETSAASVCVSAVSNRHDTRTGLIQLSTGDNNTAVAHRLLHRSTSLKEIGPQTCNGTADLKSVSFNNTVDLGPSSSFLNETGTMQDCDIDRYSRNKKRNLSRQKFRRRTSIMSRAQASSTDHSKDVVTVSSDVGDRNGLTSETQSIENTSSLVALCVPSQRTNESSSQSLLCAQKQSGGSYHLPNITVSGCCLSAIETPFPPKHSCSLKCRERCLVADESLGYRRPSTKADDIVSCVRGHKDQLKQSERCSPSDLIDGLNLNTSNTCQKEQSNRVLPATSGRSDVSTSVDAAIISVTETESKQSLSVPSNGSGRLTLPTPKNSLTSYQPASSLPSAAPVSDSLVSTASQVQPNYAVIQVLIFFTF